MSRQPSPAPETAPGRRRGRAWLRVLASVLLWLMMTALLAIALAVAAARYAADNIDRYRPQLEEVLSQYLGQQVNIDRLSASWQGVDPVVQAEGVSIAHRDRPDGSAVSLQQILLRLDGLRSVLRLGLVFERMEADGLDLVVAREENGRVAIDGLTLPQAGPGLAGVPELDTDQWLEPQRWLDELSRRISDPHIRLTHLTVGLKVPESDTLFVDIPQLDLAYQDDRMSASGRAMRQGTLDQLATFSVIGRDLFEGRFSGRMWAEVTPGGFFESLTRGLQWRHFQLEQLDASARTWLTFDQGRLQRLNGHVDVERLELRSELDGLAPVEDFSARVGWRRTDDGGSFHVRELGWRWQDDRVEGVSGRIDYDRLHFRVRAGDVPLGPLARLALASDLLPARAQYHAAGLGPEGLLSTFHMTIPRTFPKEFELAATLDGVAVESHQGAPGGANVDGQLWLDRHGGQVQVDGEDMMLHFPELFAGPWSLGHAAGRVGWRLDGGIIRVFARDLRMAYGENTRLEGAFDLRLDRYGEDNLGLKVSLRDGDAAMLPDFVPVGAVAPELYEWLTTAIREGEITHGEFYGHGQIGQDAPPASFSTAMEYRFRNGRIAYDPDWPEVTDADGVVRIHNGNMRVTLDRASTGGLALDRGEVEVVPGEQAPVVNVSARTRVNGDQVAYWLGETPLGSMAGEAAGALSVSGDYDVDLGLAIPLATGRDVGVDASLSTENGSVYYPEQDLRWQDIRGDLAYSTSDGFSDAPLSATFLGQQVSVSLGGEPDQGSLTINQQGQTDIRTLASRLAPAGQELAGIEGRLPYSATLELSSRTVPRLRVDASGAGLWSEWPAPLTREAGPEERIEALIRWPDNDRLQVEGHWGDRLAVALEWRQQAFHAGQVVLGGGAAFLPDAPGLLIRADVDRFAPGQWRHWLEEYGVAGTGDSSGAANGGGGFGWLSRIELAAETLVLGDHTLPGVKATLTPEGGGWLITTDSERATGEVRIPASGDRVRVDMDRLRLARSGDDSGEAPALLTPTEQLDAFRSMAAGQWPEVDVHIEQLWLQDDPAGAWSFLLSPSPDQVTLRDLQGQIGSLGFDGQVRWGVASGEEMTLLQGVLEGGGLEDLEALLGSQAPLTNERSVIDLDIAWPGRPDQFAASRLNGEFSLRLDDGMILKNNDTAQLFRLFNLLNTDTLQRRLSFDFSDLYEAGVAFDAISGKATLEHGVLRWNPDLQLAGPSGALRLSGLTNLADETLNMRLVVILPLTQNLPLAAILMGASPPVGGALFVLDKLLGEPLSKLTSATYSVGGSWDDPEVRLRNIFDSGNQE